MGFSYDILATFRVTVLFQFPFFQGISKWHFFILKLHLNGQDISGFQHYYLRSFFSLQN